MPDEGTDNLIRFVQAAAAAPDSPALIQAIANREGWPALCAHLVATGRTARTPSPALRDACRQAGTTPERLLKRLEPVALALRLVPEDDPGKLHRLLGLAPDAAPDVVRSAFRRRARELHPDGNPQGADRLAFTALTQAYRRLNRNPAPADRDIARAGGPGWYERPRPAPGRLPVRRRFPLALAVLLPLMVLLAFGLDFVYREAEPPHIAARPPAAAVPQPPQPDRPPTPEPPASIPPAAIPPAPAAAPAPVLTAAVVETPPPSAPPAADPPAPGLAPHHRLRLFFDAAHAADTAAVVAAFLAGRGYRTAAPSAVAYTGPDSVRFFHPDDRPAAAAIRQTVRRFLTQRFGADRSPLHLVDLSRRYGRPTAGLIEIWLSRPGAADPPPVQSAAAAPPPDDIGARLQAFIADYCRTYANGDFTRLAAFFHPAATENGQPLGALLSQYRHNLAQYAALDYRIEVSHWEQRAAPQGLDLSGRFFAHARLDNQQVRESRGRIAMNLEVRGESFAIRRLDYAIEAEP